MHTRIVAGALTVLVAANIHAGYVFTSVTKSEGGGRGNDAQNMTVKASVEGDKARIEFTESKNPMMGKGSYVLTQDAGKTMYMVSPEDKSYSKWDIEAMMGAAGAAMKMMGGFMQMEFSEPKIEKLMDEPGESILGYSTRHYKFRTTFSTTVSMMGRKNTTATVKDEEIWSTTKIADAGMGAWLRKSPPSSGNEQLDKMIRAEMNKIEGFPLRHIMVTTTDASGKQQTHKMVTEVTELSKESVAASTFVIPSDYKELKMEVEDKGEGEAAEGAKPAIPLPPGFMKFMQKNQKQP